MIARAAVMMFAAACGTAPPPVEVVANQPATSSPAAGIPGAVAGEHVTIRADRVRVAATRGGAPLTFEDPHDKTFRIVSVPVLAVEPGALRLHLRDGPAELWLWIDEPTAYPVLRTAQVVQPRGCSDCGIWIGAGVPVTPTGALDGELLAIAFPPPHTESGLDFALRFTGAVARDAVARSFVYVPDPSGLPDQNVARLPPWVLARMGDDELELFHDTPILAAPGGAEFATLVVDGVEHVAVIDRRGRHLQIVFDAGELAAVGWIAEPGPGRVSGFGGLVGNLLGPTRLPSGTCLFDDDGHAIGHLTYDSYHDDDRFRVWTPWGDLQTRLLPAAGGGWRTDCQP